MRHSATDRLRWILHRRHVGGHRVDATYAKEVDRWLEAKLDQRALTLEELCIYSSKSLYRRLVVAHFQGIVSSQSPTNIDWVGSPVCVIAS